MELSKFIEDISLYWHLFGGNGFSGKAVILRLPYSMSYFEHPYWVINKMNYILNMLNKILDENEKSKKSR